MHAPIRPRCIAVLFGSVSVSRTFPPPTFYSSTTVRQWNGDAAVKAEFLSPDRYSQPVRGFMRSQCSIGTLRVYKVSITLDSITALGTFSRYGAVNAQHQMLITIAGVWSNASATPGYHYLAVNEQADGFSVTFESCQVTGEVPG